MGFVALIGVALTVVPSMILFRIIATRRGGVRTQGTVIDNRRTVTNGASSSAPVIRFATQDGRTVEFESNISTPVVYEVGKQVPVVYQPSNPEQAILDTALGTWVIPTLSLAVGVVLLLVGLIGLLGGSSR